MLSQENQITALVRSIEPYGSSHPVDPDAPTVAIESVLRLTQEQEKRLVEFCLTSLDRETKDLGREEVLSADKSNSVGADGVPESLLADSDRERSFFAKRRMFELYYHMNNKWRAAHLGGIFEKTNFTVPMLRRLVQQMTSRAKNYFFATEPWFSGTPEGPSDDDIARDADRFLKYRARKAKVKNAEMAAIDQAFIRGEGILKSAFVDQSDFYETEAEVAVLPAGEFLMAEDGDFIFKADTWEPAPLLDEMGEPVLDEMGAPVMSKVDVLTRDKKTLKPPTLIFQLRTITRAITRHRGADLSTVHYLDFICPRNAASVEEAEIVAHLYEQPALGLAQQILLRNSQTPGDRGRIMSALRELVNASPKAGTAALMNRPELGESDVAGQANTESGEPRVKLAECYVRFDVRGDGHAPSLFVLINTETRTPIYYDYVANLTPDGLRPFHVVRANPVDGRWHGIGLVEVLESLQNQLDMYGNRLAMATGDQATFKLIDLSKTVEGQNDPDMKVNDGRYYTPLHPNTKIDDVCQTKILYEPRIEEIRAYIEFLQQHMLNMSGVGNVNDAQAAGLDSTKLATGIRNMDRTGQELFAPFLYALEEGLTSGMTAWSTLELFHLDGEEAYEYLENDTRMVAYLTSDRVRNLAMDIRLELTRYRNEQQDVQMAQSIELVTQFFTLPFVIQQQVAPMFRQLLKLREIQNADEIIQPLDPMLTGAMPGAAPGAGMMPGAQAIQPPSPENPITPVGPKAPGQAPQMT